MPKKLFNTMEISYQYLKGFNYGYTIRKELPKMAKQLLEGAKGNSEFLDGLKAGAKEYEKEIANNLKKFKQERKEIKINKDRGIQM